MRLKSRKTLFSFGAILLVLLLGASPVMAIVTNDEFTATTSKSFDFDKSKKGTKNVILLVGDGMGQSAITAARWEKAGKNLGTYATTRLSMDSMEHSCTVLTYAADSFITDSSSAGTAFACGEKTDNGVVCQDQTAVFRVSNGRNLTSILELAGKSGRATGLVSTTRITHATPAVFYAHINDRDNETVIAEQLLESKVNVAYGGAAAYFVPKGSKDPFGKSSKRTDSRDLTAEAQSLGYKVIYNTTGMSSLAPSDRKVIGLFNSSHMAYEFERAGTTEPSLSEMTESSIRILSQDKDGFFLMVEGGRIDHAGHARLSGAEIQDTLEFDDAVKVALDYAKRTDTLVLVTADHETGGLSLGAMNAADYTAGMIPTYGSGLDITGGYGSIIPASEATHTAVDVPLFISGPKSDRICHGPIDNTQIYTAMRYAMRV
jgi:alkaline phosphatase